MKVLCNLLKIYFSYVILKQRGDMVKKFICLLMIMALLLAGCSNNDKVESNSQASAVPDSKVTDTASKNTTPSPSPVPTPTPIPEKVYVLATSPDGTYSVCDNGGYKTDYFIVNNTTGEKTRLMRNWSSAEIEFISDTQFSFELNDYCIYNVDGSLEYRLSDYFPVGETDDGKDIVLFRIYHKDDGSKLILFTDRNEIVKPEKMYAHGSAVEPHLYEIAVLSADNTIEKIINTQKHVESSKSLYVAPQMELTDENTLYLYTHFWDGEKDAIGFAITVNLLTGDSKIVDYRPETE